VLSSDQVKKFQKIKKVEAEAGRQSGPCMLFGRSLSVYLPVCTVPGRLLITGDKEKKTKAPNVLNRSLRFMQMFF
jgi:hypothetical protein